MDVIVYLHRLYVKIFNTILGIFGNCQKCSFRRENNGVLSYMSNFIFISDTHAHSHTHSHSDSIVNTSHGDDDDRVTVVMIIKQV